MKQSMVNPNYEPEDADEERILRVMEQESRATPFLVRQRLEEQGEPIRKEYVNNYLDNLCRAGWVQKVTRGLYEFVEDPRESNEH